MDANTLYVTFEKAIKVNIDGSDDIFYRYKMLQLEVKHTGKDKMLKTIFPNIVKVAETLHTKPELIVAYIGYEMSRSFIDKSEYMSISGHLNAQTLSKYVGKYIETFIICKKCQLPELEYDLTKLTCHSCGIVYLPLNIKGTKMEKYISKLKVKLISCSSKNKRKDNKKETKYSDVTIVDPIIGNDIKELKVDNKAEWMTDVSDIAVKERQNELCNSVANKLLDYN